MAQLPWADARGFREWLGSTTNDATATTPPDEGATLRRHQILVREFMRYGAQRGILLYHGLGSGKSRAALAAASVAVAREGSTGKVFICMPASLRTNFENEIKIWKAAGGPGFSPRDIVWVSTNSGRASPVDDRAQTIHDVPLAGATVIVDEVHNLVLQVVNGGALGTALFNALFNARNMRIVALSGTPAINGPFELGMLLNLVHGPVRRHVLSGVTASAARVRNVAEMAGVRSYQHEHKTVTLTLAPDGFRANEKGLVRAPGTTQSALAQEAARALRAEKVTETSTWIFPRTVEAFENKFMEGDGTTARALDEFSKSALGLVSHHLPVGEDMPEVIYNPPVRLPMSPLQFQRYVEQRAKEIKQEETRRKLEKQGKEVSSVYRAYSRAVSNFAFDDVVKRVYNTSLRDQPPGSESSKKSELVSKMRAQMRARPERLRPPLLWEHSPKFASILQSLQKTRERAVVYSQFKSLEGLGLFSDVLDANGWAAVGSKGADVASDTYAIYDSSSRDKAQAALGMFNEGKEGCRVLMVSESGSEGLNLIGVRHVHLMEPYWHETRMLQVVGRAARSGSHASLDPKDKNVRVHQYLAVLPESKSKTHEKAKTKAEADKVREVDGTISTDEAVLKAGKRKTALVAGFLGALRAAAIDCTNDCYEPAAGSDSYEEVDMIVENDALVDPRNGKRYDLTKYKQKGELKEL